MAVDDKIDVKVPVGHPPIIINVNGTTAPQYLQSSVSEETHYAFGNPQQTQQAPPPVVQPCKLTF